MQDRARCRFIPRARRRVSPGSRALRRGCSRPYNPHPTEAILEAFLVSLGIVALAEIGDKTQLLALVLAARGAERSEEHTSELQSLTNLVCRLLLEKKKQ